MPCSICAAPLFGWEVPLGLCRRHGLKEPASGVSAMDLGSILPPLPPRNSVRLVHRVVAPTEAELRAVVAQHQPLSAAMRPRLVTP